MEIHAIGLIKLKAVTQLYTDITADLRRKGIKQWDRLYPNRFIIKTDIKNGHLFGLSADKKILGAVVVDTNESKKYQELKWEDEDGRPLLIHRLAVHPDYQGKGYGKQLLQFAEDYAHRNGYSSIRLDVFSLNSGAVKMYERAGYQERGMIRFPFRAAPYLCFEKIIAGSLKNDK
ncbi:GNAT family N-acetyltransferase [Neobacillus sp. MM2021_6]|uniref:GNAT family N-acetyltransferase n=1 Tax=Bacillaceae TaxID=186817 RepID=UPI001408CAAF|nr:MULTISPECIES: GNAT family N-acetyltransferase [Bacillaceae]MBO0962785.1 GNAT family N-acetyltransferase [Neobacillus sp. MM2021_6]NHC19222.1 GNAT family N-acetyltransferase [Bacillus sp. MM2020_4]